MNTGIIFVATILFVCSIFTFSMAFVANKRYKKETVKRKVSRRLMDVKKEITLRELFDLKLDKLEIMFIQAGIDTIYIDDVILFILILFILPFGINLFFNLGFFSIIIPLVLVGGGYNYLKSKAIKRVDKINKQFCDVLEDIADDLKINKNLYIAIKNTVPNISSPLKEELDLICKTVESNVDIVIALKNFADRIGNNIVHNWVDSIIFASEKKSNVADVCRKYSKKIRKRLRNSEEIKGKLQGVKAMAIMVLFILIGMLLMFYSSSEEFMSFLYTPFGKIMGIYTAISIIVTTVFLFNKIDKEITDI